MVKTWSIFGYLSTCFYQYLIYFTYRYFSYLQVIPIFKHVSRSVSKLTQQKRGIIESESISNKKLAKMSSTLSKIIRNSFEMSQFRFEKID